MMTKSACIFGLMLLPAMVWAQYDLQLRSSVQVNMDLPKRFDLQLNYQVRVDHNVQAFQASYVTAKLGYKISKVFGAAAEVRYGTSRQWDNFRYSIGVGAAHDIKRFKFKGMLRYQYQHSLTQWDEIGQYPDRHQVRLKAGIGFKAHKKIELDLSTEPMYAVSEMVGGFRRIRTQFVVHFNLPKGFALELGGFHQLRLDNPNSDVIWALLTGVSYDLPKAWWKKKEKKAKDDKGK